MLQRIGRVGGMEVGDWVVVAMEGALEVAVMEGVRVVEVMEGVQVVEVMEAALEAAVMEGVRVVEVMEGALAVTEEALAEAVDMMTRDLGKGLV